MPREAPPPYQRAECRESARHGDRLGPRGFRSPAPEAGPHADFAARSGRRQVAPARCRASGPAQQPGSPELPRIGPPQSVAWQHVQPVRRPDQPTSGSAFSNTACTSDPNAAPAGSSAIGETGDSVSRRLRHRPGCQCPAAPAPAKSVASGASSSLPAVSGSLETPGCVDTADQPRVRGSAPPGVDPAMEVSGSEICWRSAYSTDGTGPTTDSSTTGPPAACQDPKIRQRFVVADGDRVAAARDITAPRYRVRAAIATGRRWVHPRRAPTTRQPEIAPWSARRRSAEYGHWRPRPGPVPARPDSPHSARRRCAGNGWCPRG